jgi:hypothetical protein
VGPGVRLPNRRSQGAQVLQFSQQFDRVKDVIGELRTIAEAGTLLEVINDPKHKSGLVDYQDMIIVNMTTPRESTSGSAINVTIDMVHIRFVKTSTVKAPAPRNQHKVKDRGNKGTKEVAEGSKEKESVAHKLKEKLAGNSDAILGALGF